MNLKKNPKKYLYKATKGDISVILCNLGRPRVKICLFSCYRDGTIVDTTHLVCLYLLAKLLQAELEKCLRLVTNLPMTDMQNYFGANYFIYFQISLNFILTLSNLNNI